MPANVMVVNLIPRSLSGESNPDSEPNLAVNPANPQLIVASAFTPNPAGSGDAPIAVSTDGGNTWSLHAIGQLEQQSLRWDHPNANCFECTKAKHFADEQRLKRFANGCTR